MESKPKKPFSPKGGKKFSQKGKGEPSDCFCMYKHLNVKVFILISFAIDAAFCQTQWGPNLVASQAVNQVAKNPSRLSRRRRRGETNQGLRPMAATSNTRLLSSKLTRVHARGSLREEVRKNPPGFLLVSLFLTVGLDKSLVHSKNK